MKIGLIGSLAARRDAQAIPILASLIGAENDVAAAALDGLGRIGGDEAVHALLAVSPGLPAKLQPHASAALLRCAQDLLATGHGQEALPLFDKLCAVTEPQPIREAAFVGWITAQGPGGVGAAITALGESDPLVRDAAVRALRAMPGDAMSAQAAARIDDLEPKIQMQVITMLSDRGDPVARPAVVRALASRDPAVRRAALAAMAALGDASTVPYLVAMVATCEPDDQKLLAESLARLRGHGVDEALVAALADASPKVKRELIRALVARSAQGTVPALLLATADSDAAVRQEAAHALGKLAQPADGLRVIAILDKTTERTAIEAALVEIYRRTGNVAEVATSLDHANGAAKASLLKVAGALGGPASLAAVRGALATSDSDVRREAVLALGAWPDGGPLDDLVAMAATTQDAPCKVLALRGVARLATLAGDRGADQLCTILTRAIHSTKSPEEIKPLLSALGHAPCAAAARLASSYLGNAALADEAALAIVEMGERRAGHDRPAVYQAVQQVRKTCGNSLIRERADAIPPEENLALGGVATNPDGLAADGQAGGPQAAIDGNRKTYWDEVDGQKLYQLRVQLKQKATVTGIRIEGFGQQIFAPKDFQILCDGKVVKCVRNAKYQKNRLTVSLPSTHCTTLELKITGYYGGSPAIRELEIFGSEQ